MKRASFFFAIAALLLTGYTTFSATVPQQSNLTLSIFLPSIEYQEAKASAMSIVLLSKSCFHKNF